MDSIVFRHFLVKLVGVFYRAAFHAGGAAPAKVFNNVTRFPDQSYPEVPGLTFDSIDFRIAEYLYVRVPADLDQFG